MTEGENEQTNKHIVTQSVDVVSYVCSLGTLCHTGKIMQATGLKLCSYPFDWIFTDPTAVISCIEDGFVNFLDKTKYIENASWGTWGHQTYHQEMFTHRNPFLTKNYQYYERCVDRFKQLLARDDQKLFVMMFPNKDDVDPEMKNTLIEFNNKLATHTKNYRLLVIEHLHERKRQDYRLTTRGNVDFLELHTLSKTNGTMFIDDSDNPYVHNLISALYAFDPKQ